jgi:hypothetical protein
MMRLIYVWLGPVLPAWARISLMLSKNTSGLETVLLCNRSVGDVSEVSTQYYLEDFYIPPDVLRGNGNDLRVKFRHGFWIKTTERFFVLEQFVKKFSHENIFHAELDNLIFNIADLGEKLDTVGSGLFCPRDAVDRGIASLIYINNQKSLSEFTNLALGRLNYDSNDMDILGCLLNESKNFYSLPTEISFKSSSPPPWVYVTSETASGIFDAAALGQFLFGIDPRNCNGLLYNGFENENKGYDLWKLNFEIDLQYGKATVRDSGNSKEANLYNIHVHSKLFKQFLIDGRIETIIQKINAGEKTRMSLNIGSNRLARFALRIAGFSI